MICQSLCIGSLWTTISVLKARMILKLIKLYIVEITRLLSQKNHTICLCLFKVISIFVKFIGNFLTLLRQSWPLMLGHLTLPTPLNQCCNQLDMIRDAVCSSRSQQHNIERWGGEDGNWISKKKKPKKLNYVQVSQLFLSKIVVSRVSSTIKCLCVWGCRYGCESVCFGERVSVKH